MEGGGGRGGGGRSRPSAQNGMKTTRPDPHPAYSLRILGPAVSSHKTLTSKGASDRYFCAGQGFVGAHGVLCCGPSLSSEARRPAHSRSSPSMTDICVSRWFLPSDRCTNASRLQRKLLWPPLKGAGEPLIPAQPTPRCPLEWGEGGFPPMPVASDRRLVHPTAPLGPFLRAHPRYLHHSAGPLQPSPSWQWLPPAPFFWHVREPSTSEKT